MIQPDERQATDARDQCDGVTTAGDAHLQEAAPIDDDAGPAGSDRRLTIRNLHKRFLSDGVEVKAVDGISFEVGRGEVFGLLGPNGAGKTTTLRMILGLIPPDEGYAEVHGLRSDRNPEQIKQRIGFVSANTGLYPWLTARETLEFFASIYGSPRDQTERRLAELADQLDLRDFLDRRCGALSTGQTQRVNLAKALIHDPPVMLLDEPTLGLDVLGSQVVFDYLQLLKTRECAVILSTHRLEQAQRVCDRLGLLHRGRLQMCGTWDEIARTTGLPSLVDVFLSWGRDIHSAGPHKIQATPTLGDLAD